MTDRSTFVDVQADYDKCEYRVVERATGKVVARYKYKQRSDSSRGVASGRASACQHDINSKIKYPTPT